MKGGASVVLLHVEPKIKKKNALKNPGFKNLFLSNHPNNLRLIENLEHFPDFKDFSFFG